MGRSVKFDKKTAAMLLGAIAIWAAFFALGGGKGLAGWIGSFGAEGEARKLVAHDLKDPSSAQFREIHKTDQAVCGEVNAKNSYGAYVGFKHFIVDGSSVSMEPETPSERLSPGISPQALAQWGPWNAFDSEWTAKCNGPGPTLDPSLEPYFPGLTDKVN